MTMTGDPARARHALLIASALAWILILAEPGSSALFSHCPVLASGAMPFAASFRMLLTMNSPFSLAAGWSLMLVAMMAPAVIAPVLHVRLRSFRRRRTRATALFLAAYGAVWMTAGIILLTMELVAGSFAPQSFWPVATAVTIAIIWQCTPLKQRCLNRCHLHREIRAFGSAADLDTIRFGVTHGFWCVGSCWAIMLAPMLLSHGHVLAMAMVSVLMFGEWLEHPAPPSWRWRGIGRLKRLAVARTRVRLNELVRLTVTKRAFIG
jgi:predicted metal-binding membrane protein